MQKQICELLKIIGKNQRLSKFAVSETGFLFDPVTGQSFTLNQTGLSAFNHLKKGASIEDTAALMAEEYCVSKDAALNSLEAFVIQLGRMI